jgi:hypothetical protein
MSLVSENSPTTIDNFVNVLYVVKKQLKTNGEITPSLGAKEGGIRALARCREDVSFI